MLGSRREARERALSLLYEADAKGIAPAAVLAELPVAPDRFAAEEVAGVGDCQDRLDALITGHAVGWAVDRMPVVDRTLLRMAIWELLERPDIPTGAIISEAVELAKTYSTEESGRFVNGVLGSVAADVRGVKRGMTSSLAAAAGTFTLGGDLTVNRMGFGAMRITGEGIWGEPADRAEAIAVLRRAVELGVDLIDTADSYGPFVSEDLIAEALYPYPDGLVIATKGGLTRTGPEEWHPVGRPEYLTQCVEMSLRRLRLDCIDLYQFHEIDAQVPLEESIGTLAVLQAQGKIRHLGVSNFNVDDLARARRVARVVSVQNRYNFVDRRSDDVLAVCEADGLGFLPWAPVDDGRLSRPGGRLDAAARRHGVTVSQLSLAWLLHRSPVMLPIPGTSRVDHLEENMAAAGLALTADEWTALEP